MKAIGLWVIKKCSVIYVKINWYKSVLNYSSHFN